MIASADARNVDHWILAQLTSNVDHGILADAREIDHGILAALARNVDHGILAPLAMPQCLCDIGVRFQMMCCRPWVVPRHLLACMRLGQVELDLIECLQPVDRTVLTDWLMLARVH